MSVIPRPQNKVPIPLLFCINQLPVHLSSSRPPALLPVWMLPASFGSQMLAPTRLSEETGGNGNLFPLYSFSSGLIMIKGSKSSPGIL